MKNSTSILVILVSVIILFIFTNRQWIWRGHSFKINVMALKTSKNEVYSSEYKEKRCRIFSYFEFLPTSIDPLSMKNLEIWGYAFYAQGFFPIILNEENAQLRTDFTNVSKIFSKFPTSNPSAYELSCYIRWVALQQQGGGLFMDYDILPMVNPMAAKMRALKKCRWGHLTTYDSMKPMVTHGNASEIEKWIQYMLNFNISHLAVISGKSHISDMYMAIYASQHTPELFNIEPDLPWFHYSTYARLNMSSYIKSSASEVGLTYYILCQIVLNNFCTIYFLINPM